MLVSGLLAGLALAEETLLDKLELFFSKPRHGGGEVDTRELLQGGAVLGFADVGGEAQGLGTGAPEPRRSRLEADTLTILTVAQHLCQVGQFRVPLGSQEVPLRVTPYVNGVIQKAVVSALPCHPPTLVLLCTALPQPPTEAPAPCADPVAASAQHSAGAGHCRRPGWPRAARRPGGPLPEAHMRWRRGGGSGCGAAWGAGPGCVHLGVGLGLGAVKYNPHSGILPGLLWDSVEKRLGGAPQRKTRPDQGT